MAGAAGKIMNRSGFSSFIIKEWASWMTEAVILHASGMSIPELRVRFGKTDQHLRNLMNTSQATEIINKIAAASLSRVEKSSSEKITAIREKALDVMLDLVSNDELKAASPFAFWDAARKTSETVSKLDVSHAPAAAQTSITQNIQNNLIASPEMMQRLREGVSLPSMEVPTNVEYLGSPPPRETAGELFAGGVHTTPSESKNGLTLLNSKRSNTP